MPHTIKMPALFISHGSPMLAVQDNTTTRFFSSLGQSLPKPSAIIVFSAHYDQPDTIHVTSNQQPDTIHDFYGFPEDLYQIQYPAPGNPELAVEIGKTLSASGYDVQMDGQRGLDHGAWVPLKWLYPDADIPVVQISINSRTDTNYHYRLGRSLRTFREQGILFIGSGGITHNLRAYFKASTEPDYAKKAEAFNDWVKEKLTTQEHKALLEYQSQAPFATFNHPSPEHFCPLHCVLGTIDSDEAVIQLHHAMDNDVLSLDAYQFGKVPA